MCWAACAGSPRGAKRLAPEDELLAFAPTGASMLVDVDVARVRDWSSAHKLLEALSRQRQELAAALGFDLVQDVDRQLLWFRRLGSATEYVAISRGRFEAGRVRAAVESRGGKVLAYRGVPFFQAGDSAGVFLADNTFALGTIAGVQAAVDVLHSVAPAAKSDEEVMRLRASAGLSGRTIVRVAAVVPPSEGERRSHLRSLVWRVDAGAGLDVTMTSEHEDVAQATEGAQQLKQLALDARQQLGGMGLGAYLDALLVTTQGTRVMASLRLSDQQCEELAGLLARLMPLLMQSAGWPPQNGKP
ncbi:MAG TPA: hypothetical protein VKN99_23520 [Polyangia bacterium]|nr:hypothetical protein [Polyangia bacterium]